MSDISDQQILEFINIFHNDVDTTEDALDTARVLSFLIQIKYEDKCCSDENCPANPYNQLKRFVEQKADFMQRTLYHNQRELISQILKNRGCQWEHTTPMVNLMGRLEENVAISWWVTNRKKLNEVIDAFNSWQIAQRFNQEEIPILKAKISACRSYGIRNEFSEWQFEILKEIEERVEKLRKDSEE